MSNISAGIGRGQMEVLEKRVEARRKNHDFYMEVFKDFHGVDVLTEPNSDFYSNHWLSAIVINPEKTAFTREDIRLKLLEDNIESRPLWKTMHLITEEMLQRLCLKTACACRLEVICQKMIKVELNPYFCLFKKVKNQK